MVEGGRKGLIAHLTTFITAHDALYTTEESVLRRTQKARTRTIKWARAWFAQSIKMALAGPPTFRRRRTCVWVLASRGTIASLRREWIQCGTGVSS